MNNKADMTLDDLREVLLENELTNFDPVAEAFKVILCNVYERIRAGAPFLFYIFSCVCRFKPPTALLPTMYR